MTVAQAVRNARARGLDVLDAQLLVLQALGRLDGGRAWLLGHDQDPVPGEAQERLEPLLQRRAAGEPLAYLTGHKEFYGLALQVDARVLDPRPDTETLVDWALECMDAWGGAADATPPALIDLGTGSGAIALALKHSRPGWQVQALDYSTDALAVARANAERLSLPVAFRQGSWLEGVAERFALIVSNPPYIASADPHLQALTHEPLQALASGPDGLDDMRAIVAQAPNCLQPGGWLLLEHGHDQAVAVRALLQGTGFDQVQSRRDLAGIERCSGGRWGTPA